MLPILDEIDESGVVYLDVDMSCQYGWDSAVRAQMRTSDAVCVVPHPGFPKVGTSVWWRMVTSRRGLVRASAAALFRRRSRVPGAWETSDESLARVEPKRRLMYVHGAVWFGPKEDVKSMVAELASRVQGDLDHGIIATWHDESHLNWFAANREVVVSDPQFSSVTEWSALRERDWVFSSVEKDFNRE